ncbi:hypothetical protein [Deinococcus soli (ex Cha et al. 2016)]|uniref:DUF7352 domain-containing protein n=2 Tax=Deinococcus soli (ex Cha et al. 2016) TaxID=1309411 RepID=A0AAE4BL90_9DEIO|nr:hypothetical protein [Deinococcus soli (ex Cha et al. 2016)]MDR6218688.1 hypothetical protein [Deinococcus soli (ex Cha et al. 2016)]MDR6328485.1 hypothetical protein [Deinococcus soli (ex Cha et al. 2016)]MDR6753096.1 hypothetical protein [Deinococcus soli (ex Cha et al. 2016)]
MHRIFKYPLTGEARQVIELPAGARLLHVDDQRGTLTLWAAVDPGADAVDTYFIRIYLTGERVDLDLIGPHLGTVLLDGGATVVHVFASLIRTD